MEPIDRRVTAAQLMTLRLEPNAAEAIAELLKVDAIAPRLATRTRAEIREFVATGDAVLAAQLVHAVMVRRKRTQSARGHATGLRNGGDRR